MEQNTPLTKTNLNSFLLNEVGWIRTNGGGFPIGLQPTTLTTQSPPRLLMTGLEPVPKKDEVLSLARLPFRHMSLGRLKNRTSN